MRYLDQLKETARRTGIQPKATSEFLPDNIEEPPRFPIRAGHFFACLLVFAVVALAAFMVGNPIARIHDPRIATRYHDKPLTCLAAGAATPHVWIGSDGGGIRTYSPQFHFFLPDLTRSKSRQQLLADHILSLDFRGELAAIAATDGPIFTKDSSVRGGGLQIAKLDGASVEFWPRPCIDLSRFPGLSDSVASAVAASPDHGHLIVGTKGMGLGVYSTATHSWTSICRSPDHLPSDKISDLAAFASAGRDAVLWVGTDHGICEGRIDAGGVFVGGKTYGLAEGLAGEDIQRLKIANGCLWYRTAAQGFGRIVLNEVGEPRSEDSHEMLISERKLEGVNDAGLRLAAGSPAGPTTWFLAENGNRRMLGRYREKPHDTTGVVLSDDFPFNRLTCIATEAEAGQSVIIGTEDGAWLFREQKIDGLSSAPVTFNKLSEIRGGNIGPVGQRVEEAALGGTLAIAKTRIADAPHALLKAEVGAVGPAQWQSLVGPSRFLGVASLREATAAAQSGARVFFGTAGKGIGVWDRDALEVRREFHTSQNNLHNDTTLDLAASGQEIFQVTGDRAVDVIGGLNVRPFIPPDSAPFAPEQLNAAAAEGTLLAVAGAGRIGIYDGRKFSWKERPALSGLSQLHLTTGMLWGLTDSRQLHMLPELADSWQSQLDNVVDLSAPRLQLGALSRGASGSNGLFAFDGISGKQVRTLQPVPLGLMQTPWKFATNFGPDLLLAGDVRELHRYTLTPHQWRRIPMPDAVRVPFRAAVRTAGWWWLLDSGGQLHRVSNDAFEASAETEVEKISGSGTRITIGLTRNRWVLRDDAGGRKVLVGDPFEGNLSRVTFAAQWQQRLAVVADGMLGVYDPQERSWLTVRAASPIDCLYTAGDAVWVRAGRQVLSLSADASQPGRIRLQPVLAGERPVEVAQAAPDGGGLWVLDPVGGLWVISAAAPERADLRVMASKIPGTGNLTPLGLFSGLPLLFTGQEFVSFRGSPGQWHSQPTDARPVRFAFINPAADRLVGWNAEQAWLFEGIAREGAVRALPMAPARSRVTNAVVGDGEAGCAVTAQGEQTLQIVSMAGNQPARPVPGAALPRSAATAAFVQDSAGKILRLDRAGQLGIYDPQLRAWGVEQAPAAFDEIWSDGPCVFGYQRSTGLLAARLNGNWSIVAQTTSALVRHPGALAWKMADGSWHWRNAAGNELNLFPAQIGRPSLGGGVEQAMEWESRLLLRDSAGHASVYDPETMRWENLEGATVRDMQLDPVARRPVLLIENGGRRQLFQPTMANGRLIMAPLLTAAAPVSWISFAVRPDGILALGTDGLIYEIFEGRSQPLPGAQGVKKLWRTEDGFAAEIEGGILQVKMDAEAGFLADAAEHDSPSVVAAKEQPNLTAWELPVAGVAEMVRLLKVGTKVSRVPVKLLPQLGWDCDAVSEVRLEREQAWLRTGAGWRVLRREGNRFVWEGFEADAPATALPDTAPPAFSPVGAQKQHINFDPQTGRFDADTFLGLGSADGKLWVLTAAGLERLSDHSSQPLPEGLRASDLHFGKDGEILDAGGHLRLAWVGGSWKAGEAPPEPAAAPAGAWRFDAASGAYQRARPQEPQRFDPAAINAQRRWNFETMTGLSASEGCALLATEGGPSVMTSAGNGWAAAWPRGETPDYQPAKAFFDGTRWVRATDRQPFQTDPEPRTDGPFQWTRTNGGTSLQFTFTGETAARTVHGGRFDCDLIHDAFPGTAGIALSTEAGLATIPADGGALILVHGSARQRFDFVPSGDAVFARASSRASAAWVLRGGQWLQSTSAEAVEAATRANRTLIESETWRVTRADGGTLAFAMRLGGEGGNDFKPVPFVPTRGAFGFDLFRCIAPGAADREWIIGTEAGIISINADGVFQRLWCDSATDGVGAEPVERLTRSEDGRLLARTSRGVLSLPQGGTTFQNSTAAEFATALALRANDPKGWRIEQTDRAPKLSWTGEPVSLVPWANGRARFAHNVILSVAATGRDLLFGTEGGLLRTQGDDSRTTSLLARPFSAAGGLPDPLVWLCSDSTRASLRGRSGAAYEVDLREFKRIAAAPGTPAPDEVAKDDLLRWRHPAAGTVDVSFQPERTVPADLQPIFADGTFTFLNLDLDGTSTPPSTLRQSPAGLFWLSRAGIIQYDAKERRIERIHARSTDKATVLTTVRSLYWDVLQKKLFAGRDRAEVEFDGNAWRILPARFAGTDLTVVGDSRYLSWRQEPDSVKVTVKQTDDPSRPFFGTGRPLLDEVQDFAFAGTNERQGLSLATAAGVADFSAGDFSWEKLHTRSFQGQPVLALAMTNRQCARTASGGYEFADGQWRAAADVSDAFTLESQRVKWADVWTWSQTADGITCTFLNTNGPPFIAGTAANSLPIFSGEKIAIDDVRGAVLTADELLIATPLGCVHHRIDPTTQRSEFTGLDTSLEDPAGTTLGSLDGITHFRENLFVWGKNGSAWMKPSQPRTWKRADTVWQDRERRRLLADGRDAWEVALTNERHEVAVTYGSGSSGTRWYSETQGGPLRAASVSPLGLWFIVGNDLYLASLERANRSIKNLMSGSILPTGNEPSPPTVKVSSRPLSLKSPPTLVPESVPSSPPGTKKSSSAVPALGEPSQPPHPVAKKSLPQAGLIPAPPPSQPSILPATNVVGGGDIASRDQSPAKPEQQFHVTLTADKQQYHIGENIRFSVASNRDCYVRLYCEKGDHKVVQLFPYSDDPKSFLKANYPMTIPQGYERASDGNLVNRELKVGSPTGPHRLRLVALERPFADADTPKGGDVFLNEPLEKVATRGISSPQVNQSAIADLTFNVLPAESGTPDPSVRKIIEYHSLRAIPVIPGK